jgi:ankyrin repeat protein
MESNTGLHLASQAGNVEFIKLLVEYGADLNAVSIE